MKTVSELIKEKILLRSSNPIRADLLGLLLSEAKQIAKEENREASGVDVQTAAKGLLKKLQKMLPDVVGNTNLYARTNLEIEVLKSFLPATLDREKTKLVLEGIILTLPPENKASRKEILAHAKNVEGIDMAMVNSILNETLKKDQK